MSGNTSLRAAERAKQDEFYTQISDIENELNHYKEHFRDKVVFCNCDDPYESNFFKYFANNFNEFRLRKLIATCYNGSPVSGNELLLNFGDSIDDPKKIAYKVEITEVRDFNGDGSEDLADIRYLMQNDKNVISILHENGDFRSQECVALLKEADIVVTNPPFSLFRKYVEQLMTYNKKFLIIGNQNALTYKDIFTYIKMNKLWLGYKFGDMSFQVPSYFTPRATRYWIDATGQKWRSMGNVCWFTNLDIQKRHESLILYKKYTPEEYPKYDNYNAININKVADIPFDYEGVMGVPITFMDKYNPEQFELLGIMNTGEINEGIRYSNTPHGRPVINGKELYLRILIRRKR